MRDRVVDEEPVLEVLAGVGEVQPEQLGVAAGSGVGHLRIHPDQVAAEGDDDRVRRASRPTRRRAAARWTASSAQSWTDHRQRGAVADENSTLSAYVAEPV